MQYNTAVFKTHSGVTLVQFYCSLCLILALIEPESNLLTDI